LITLFDRKACSWANTAFSLIFEIKGRFEICQKLERDEESRLGFLIYGVLTACLRQTGTVPAYKHLLMTDSRPGPIASIFCLRKCEEMCFKYLGNVNLLCIYSILLFVRKN